jgi:Flp pilus assembly protein TadG
MMAFSVDTGYMVEVRAELQRTADAAALGGIQQLYASYRSWQTASSASQSTIATTAISNAKATASAVAQNNQAGNVAIELVASDMDVGYTDGNGNYYSGGAIPTGQYPNTVKVTARRDNTTLPNSNGELPLFFGPVLGMRSVALTASATATAYEGLITDLKSISGVNGDLLPVAVDAIRWTDFFQNGANSLYADPNSPPGQAWLQIHSGGLGTSMDGLLSVDGTKAPSQQSYDGSNGWIESGPSSADIAGLHAVGDLPLDGGQSWSSGPGLKSSELQSFQALITAPPTLRLLPIFDMYSPGTTNGGNGTYEIIAFVPVYVVYAQGQGQTNMDIAVVPAPGVVTDPTAIITGILPLSSSSTSIQYLVPVAGKLSQ